MKKLVLVIALMLVSGFSWADALYKSADVLGSPIEIIPSVNPTIPSNWLGKIPGLKQGVMYNVPDGSVSYISTIELASWKKATLEGGFSSDNAAMIGALSYPIVNLKELGVTLPILDLVELNVGMSAGYKFGDGGEWMWGPSATIIDVKF